MTALVQSAIRLGIDPHQIVVLRSDTMIGMSSTGAIYMHRSGRWHRLQPATQPQPNARRLIRYTGHHDSARSANG